MSDAILVLNAGSSSIKFALFEVAQDCEPALLCKGMLDEHDAEPRLVVKDTAGEVLYEKHRHAADSDSEALMLDTLSWVDTYLAADDLLAVGHRVVHGGQEFSAPVQIDERILKALNDLTPLAPLHQPRSLAPVRVLMNLRPEMPQIACFDTAFHHSLTPEARRFAIPRNLDESGIHRYGFHGLSFEYVARRLGAIAPELPGKRTVVAHLGSGASLCALQDGLSIDTTMGLTPLDGLMMGTRCGALDPGVVLYLQRVRGMSVGAVERMLYEESGLLGVSGISADMRALLASTDPRAAEAVDLFSFRVAREVAMMASSLAGLECLVFTGGIGEHAAEVRRRVCERLGWLGVAIDATANAQATPCISSADSRVTVLIVPTSEETMIARHCRTVLNQR
jgi:acetate kinase